MPHTLMPVEVDSGLQIVNRANEVFGFDGWSSSIVSLTTDFVDHCKETGESSVGVTAVVRITLTGGTFHEDIGCGFTDKSASKGAALEKVCTFPVLIVIAALK